MGYFVIFHLCNEVDTFLALKHIQSLEEIEELTRYDYADACYIVFSEEDFEKMLREWVRLQEGDEGGDSGCENSTLEY